MGVSTAYYAIFHLLIDEATVNWGREELRPELGRLFDHGRMRAASTELQAEIVRSLPKGTKGSTDKQLNANVRMNENLRIVASTFLGAQQARNQSDYNTAKIWNRDDALWEIERVAEAFEAWRAVRMEPRAQAYLLSLLGKRS